MREKAIYVPQGMIRERFSGWLTPEMIDAVERLLDAPRVRLYLYDNGGLGGGKCVWPSARQPYYSIYVKPPKAPGLEHEMFHTFLHEIAHWKAGLRRANSSHGLEWQEEFKKLMLEHLQLFPADLQPHILDYLDKTPRKRFPMQAYYQLSNLMNHGQRALYEDWKLSDIPVGVRFRLVKQIFGGFHGTYIKKQLAKNGKAWHCMNVHTGKFKAFAAETLVWNTEYYDFETDNEEMDVDDDVEEEVKHLMAEADSIEAEAESEKQFSEAEDLYRRALSVACTNFYDLMEQVWNFVSYGNLQTDFSNYETEVTGRGLNIRRECEAMRYFEEALKMSRYLSRDGDELGLYILSAVLNDFGRCCFFFDYYERGVSYYEEALDIRRKWSEKNPELWLEFYASSLWNLSLTHPYPDEPEKERSLFQEALRVYGKLEEQDPGKYTEELQSIRESLCENNNTTMEKKEVLKSVCELVSEHLDLPLKEVKKNVDVPFLEYKKRNGESACEVLDFTELLLAIEDEFSIEIPEEDEDKLATINDAVNYIMTAEVVDYDDEVDDEGDDEEDDEEDNEEDNETSRQLEQEIYKSWVKNFGKEMADEMAADLFG